MAETDAPYPGSCLMHPQLSVISRERNLRPVPVRSAVGAGETPGRNRNPHGSLCGLTVRTAVSIWWAREGSNLRPYGCELARSKPLPRTLRYGRLDNLRDSGLLIAVRSTVAPKGPSLDRA